MQTVLEIASLILFWVSTSASASGTGQAWPVQTYRSSNARPPVLNLTKSGRTSAGYLFLTPESGSTRVESSLIFDDRNLIWQGPSGNVTNFYPQTLHGQQVLSYWAGNTSEGGWGSGSIHLLNTSYDEIYEVSLAGNETWVSPLLAEFPSYIDKHEALITERGSVLVSAINATRGDLRPFSGPTDGWIQDNLFYEIRVETNEVLFRWSGVEHADVIDPHYSSRLLDGKRDGSTQATPWDYMHINSIAPLGDDYLVSFKCLDTIALIQPDGSVKWKLNGRTGGDFTLGPGTNFISQHNIRVHERRVVGNNDIISISMHNNGVSCNKTKVFPSNGLLLDVDVTSKQVMLNRKLYDPSDPVYSSARGNCQSLPGGHVLVGHGIIPGLEEYDENDNCVLRVQYGFSPNDGNYAAIRSAWVGTPRTSPQVVACRSSKDRTRLYISWNGATDIGEWEIWTGGGEDTSQYTTRVKKTGFETVAEIDGTPFHVAVRAVGGPNHGHRSTAVKVNEAC
ncbi:ASST-domain-containing protein [Aspergillus floccosus]